MKLFAPVLKFLQQGMAPERLAVCVAIGVVIGNIPILGLSSILCGAIALLFRLNLPAIQLVQAAMSPSQLLLIVPFVRLGEWLLHAPREPVSIDAGLALLGRGVGHAVQVLWSAIVHAGLAWALIAPLAGYLFYRLLVPIFRRVALDRAAGQPS